MQERVGSCPRKVRHIRELELEGSGKSRGVPQRDAGIGEGI